MVLLKKAFSTKSKKRQLKRSSLAAIDFATKTYWEQLALDEGQRDGELMDECLSVIRCASSILHEGTRRSQFKFFSCQAPVVRAVAVTVICLFMVIALSTGVAYAMGYNLWHIVFNVGNGTATIYGKPQNPNDNYVEETPPLNTLEPSDGFLDFTGLQEALEYLAITPVLLTDTYLTGVQEDAVYATVTQAAITLFIDYSYGDAAIHYMTVKHPDPNNVFALTAGVQGESLTREMGGVTFYITKGDGEHAVMWCEDCYAYQIIADIDFDELMGALEELYLL